MLLAPGGVGSSILLLASLSNGYKRRRVPLGKVVSPLSMDEVDQAITFKTCELRSRTDEGVRRYVS